MTATAGTPAARVLPTLFAYGKLALLVEDAPDAEIRTARELYGADGLPQWWICVNNLEQAALAIREAVAAIEDRGPEWARGLPLLVVLDRYLQIGTGSGASRIVAWDRPGQDEPPAVEAMGEAVRMLQEHCKPPRRTSMLAAVTSYPEARAWPGFSWRPRHHEPLFRLRRDLARNIPSLLSFGPAPEAPAALRPHDLGDFAAAQRDEMACRARLWQRVIPALAGVFRRTGPCECARILFTGAGASLANGPLAPGIPPTWFLLEWASWWVCRNRRLWKGEERPEPFWPTPSKPKKGGQVGSLDELINLYSQGDSVAELHWEPLENLFKDRGSRYADDFAGAFRLILQRYDHAFPYHTWLLAQLPWTLIMTTNFDSFHERAAGAAVSASSAVANDPVRRLGDIVELRRRDDRRRRQAWSGPESVQGMLQGAGLFKPHGSLTMMGPLTLSQQDFWNPTESIRHCLDLVRRDCKECWLVVIGHALSSSALDYSFKDLDLPVDKRGFVVRVLWIDPNSCKLASSPHSNTFQGKFERALLDGGLDPWNGKPEQRYFPFPARALDFAYDLWQEYQRLGQSGSGEPGGHLG